MTTTATDIFSDVKALGLSPETLMAGKASEVIATVPVRKPHRQEFIRVNPDPAMSLTTGLFEDKTDRSVYFVHPDMRGALADEMKSVLLVTAITRQGACFLWPITLPRDVGGSQDWSESAIAAAALAKESWVRVAADVGSGHYRIYQAKVQVEDPVWPEKTISELMRIAFKKKTIDRADHPIVKRLDGHK
jgi:hypothetical protein